MRNILLGSFSVLYNDWLPYASGCLISHCKKIPEITQKYIFLEPLYKQKPVEEYYSELMNADILGLTCYVWNQSYNDEMAKYFKTIKPMGIVVYGGPQVPEDVKLKKEYDDLSPSDYSIAGLGEIAFSEWLLGLPFSNKKLTEMTNATAKGSNTTTMIKVNHFTTVSNDKLNAFAIYTNVPISPFVSISTCLVILIVFKLIDFVFRLQFLVVIFPLYLK